MQNQNKFSLELRRNVANILSAKVGFPVSIAEGLFETLKYQVMPSENDGFDFFHWYCDNFSEQQWHDSPIQASVTFLQHWMKYKGLLKYPQTKKEVADGIEY